MFILNKSFIISGIVLKVDSLRWKLPYIFYIRISAAYIAFTRLEKDDRKKVSDSESR